MLTFLARLCFDKCSTAAEAGDAVLLLFDSLCAC